RETSPFYSTLLSPPEWKKRRGNLYCHEHLPSFHSEVSEFECDKLLDDIKATKKDTALRLALSRLASDFGRESMLSLQRFFSSRRAPVISTGLLKGLLFKQQHAARKVSAFSCIVNKFNNIVV
ncbi:hypothetical protein CMV_026795, partial [Castanea mollissima]